MQARKKFGKIKFEKPEENFNENHTPGNKIKNEKKGKTKKKKRLIIRNLSFKVTKKELHETFSKFGNVIDINIPVKKDGKMRGFAFVEFDDTKSVISAIKALNNKEIHGRPVAIDFAIDRTTYQLKLQSMKQETEVAIKKENDENSSVESEDEKANVEEISESEEEMDENQKKANEFLRDFESGFESVMSDEDSDLDESENEEDNQDKMDEENDSGDSEEEDSDDDDEFERDSQQKQKKDSAEKKQSNDVSEGKTVFLKNVSFVTSEESLADAMQRYGDFDYCKICIDPFTEHSRGTAFVKFKNKDDADRLIQESLDDPGVMVDGRKLMCTLAVSRETILEQANKQKTPKDKRNLYLLKVGLIMQNSPESEGVSLSDMKKRAQLEMIKRHKLKNVNFFISDTRLLIHNLPKTFNDAELKKLLKEAAGKGAVITEAKVMKEFKKTNSEGIPLSKGFGFVNFKEHEFALKALQKLNNNPKIFNPQKRPIVEFSVESRVALLTQERRKERIQQRNKKRLEEKQERKASGKANNKNTSDLNIQSSPKKNKKRKRSKVNHETNSSTKINNVIDESKSMTKKLKKNKKRKKSKGIDKSNESIPFRKIEKGGDSIKSKPKKKQHKRKPPMEANRKLANQQKFNDMVNKFKEKIINKL